MAVFMKVSDFTSVLEFQIFTKSTFGLTDNTAPHYIDKQILLKIRKNNMQGKVLPVQSDDKIVARSRLIRHKSTQFLYLVYRTQ